MKKNLLIFLLCFCGGIVLQAQSISTVVPSQNPVPEGGSLSVGISGTNTHFAQGSATYVTANVGGQTVYGYVNGGVTNTNMTVDFYLPCGACGPATLWVNNPIDGQMSYPNAFTVSCAQITSVDPDTVTAGQLLPIQISGTGTNFLQGSTTVYFQNASTGQTLYPLTYNVINNDSLSILLPISSNICEGSYNLHAYSGGNCPLYFPNALYINGLNGQITAVNPGVANAGQTLPVGISGTGVDFTQGTLTVYFRNTTTGQTLYPTTYNTILVDSVNVDLSIPNYFCSGAYDVCYTTSANYCPTCLPGGLLINGLTVSPQIDSVSPDTAQGGRPLSVNISGTGVNFQQGSWLYFQLTNTTTGASTSTYNHSASLSDPTQTTVYFPYIPAVCGSYDLSIYGADPCGGAAVTYPNAVTVNATLNPQISWISPTTGLTGQTLSVDLSGYDINFMQGSTSFVMRLVHTTTGATLAASNLTPDPLYHSRATVDFNPSASDCGLYHLEIDGVPTGCGDTITLVDSNAININSLTSPHIQSVFPNHGQWGQTVTSTITAPNVDFNQVNIADLYLYNSSNGVYIYATNIVPNPSDPSQADVTFVIPWNPPLNGYDFYDVVINNIASCGAPSLVLPNGFEVYIPVGTAKTTAKSALEVQIYPNPMNEQATLKIVDGEDQPMIFNLYDILGKKVASRALKGNTTITIERNDLSSGVYLYRLSDEQGNALHVGKLELR